MAMTTFCPADDWGTFQLLNPEEQLPTSSILGFPDYTCISDPLFETFDFSSENFSADVLPNFYFPTDDYINLASLSPQIFPSLDEYENILSYQHYPKRQKCSHDLQNLAQSVGNNTKIQCNNSNSFGIPSYCHGFDHQFLQPQLMAPTPSPCPETRVQNPPANINKPNNGVVTLSAQSIAARERRRRITEKTQELGRLIPGATKMNTAEMLQAAYKYVKFLQAQVSILKVMNSSSIQQERKEERLRVVASPIVQEKLYSEEKCLVLKEFVQVLANDQDIQSKPELKDNVAQLLLVD